MLYLLTLGWPWFVSAVALGLVVGVATKPRHGGLLANLGFALLGAAILILLAAALWAEKFQGREALTLEFAVLAGSAYFVGVLGGGAIRTGAAAQPMEKPKSRQAAAPTSQFHSGGAVPRAEPTSTPSARVAPAPTKRNASLAPGPSGEKALPGKRPEALAAPRADGADDLKKIKGIGPKSEEKLNALGIYHYDQIADWSLDNARWIGAALATPGRIERGKWIQQAREFAAHQHHAHQHQSPTA
jgi:predicted flap endonuclease-1-like 5' DNA nuclease